MSLQIPGENIEQELLRLAQSQFDAFLQSKGINAKLKLGPVCK